MTQGPKDDTEKSRKIAELTTKLVLKTRQLEKANKKVNRLTTSVQSLEHERMRAWPNSPPKVVESNDSTRELKSTVKALTREKAALATEVQKLSSRLRQLSAVLTTKAPGSKQDISTQKKLFSELLVDANMFASLKQEVRKGTDTRETAQGALKLNKSYAES